MAIRKASKSTINATSSLTNPAQGGATVPVINSIVYTDSSYNSLDDTAVALTGGYAKILGSGFNSSVNVYLNGTQVSPSNITYVSSNEIRTILPAANLGTYALMLFNSNNFGMISPTSVMYSPFPTYGTPISVAIVNNVPFSQQLGATGDNPLSYSVISGSLPAGVSLSSSGLLSGTPTGYTSNQTINFTIQVDDAQKQTITQVITVTILVGDLYFANTQLLLSSDNTLQTANFVADNSINNAQLTVVGDTRAQTFNPYQLGYYSYQFGSSIYLNTPSTAASLFAFGTNDFTVEMFIYFNDVTTSQNIYESRPAPTNGAYLTIYVSSGTIKHYVNSADRITSGTVVIGTWYHLVVSRVSGTTRMFINGVQAGSSYSDSTSYLNPSGKPLIGSYDGSSAGSFTGLISNLRVVNGAGVTTVTVPTTPLLPIPNTVLLTCMNNTINKDSSVYNLAIAATGAMSVKSANPFTTLYQAGTQYYSTSFNGSTDQLSITTSTLALGSGSFTIECWVYLTTSNSAQCIIDLRNNSTSTTGFFLGVVSSGVIQVWNQANVLLSTGTMVGINSWNHIAITRNVSSMNVWLNGVSVGTATDSTNWTDTGVVIGKSLGTEILQGYISNLRIIKGSAIYSSSFTPSTTPLTAIANTALLTCQSNRLIDNSTNNLTINNVTTTVKPMAVSPFTPSSYTSTQITTYGSGYFDGTGDYLTGTIDISCPGNFTLEFWVFKLASPGADMLKFGSEASGRVSIGIDSSNNLFYNIFGASNVNFGTVGNNAWYHIAITRSGSTITGFINGIYSGTSTSAVTFGNNGGFTIGNTHNGYISDLRLIRGTALYTSNFVPQFTSPLSNVTNTQLLTLQTNVSHNNSVFKDQSGFNNLITRTGNVTNGTFSPYGDNWSTYISSGNYISTGKTYSFAGDFTIEAWAYYVGSSWANYAGIVGHVSGSSVFAPLYISGTTGKLECGNWGMSAYVVSNTVLNLNAWNHVALVRSGSTMRFYINGIQDINTSTTSGTLTTGTLTIGYIPNPSYWTGYISNVRIVNGTALYTTATYLVPTAPLTAVANTQLLTAQSPFLTDNSLSNTTLTTTGSPTVQKFSPFSTVTVSKYYSTYFNGSNDYTSTTNNSVFYPGTSDFTVEFWMYHTNWLGGYGPGIGQGYKNTPTGGWTIYRNTVLSNGMGIRMAPQGGGSFTDFFSNTVPTNNTWQHWAMVRTGTTLKWYLNGVLDNTLTSFTMNITDTDTTSPMYVGYSQQWGYYFGPGYLSNVRYVKGVAVYTGAFTPSTSPLTATQSAGTNISAITGTQTSLLTCQDNTFKDNSTNNFTITAATTTVKPLPVSPFTPTISSSTSYSTTTFGGSMYFDSTGDYLSLGTSALLNPGTSDFTLEFWIYVFSTPTNQSIWEGYTSGLSVSFNGSNFLQVSQSNVASLIADTVAFPLNMWVNVAVTRSGTSLKLFKNGVIVGSATNSTNFTAVTNTYITYNGANNPPVYISCYMADIRFVKGAALYTSNFYPGSTPLTPTTTFGTTTYSSNLLLNGTSGGVIDATRTIDLETVGDSKVTSFSPYNGSYYSVYYNGSTDYLTLPAGSADFLHTLAAPWTIECWFYAISVSSYKVLFSTSAGSQAIGVTFVVADTSTGDIGFTITKGTAGTFYKRTYTAGSQVTANTWNHAAVTHTGGGVLKIYINGVDTSYSTIGSGTGASSSTATYVPAIGRYQDTTPGGYFSGYISNLRLINGQALYTANFTPSTSPLTAVSGTSLLTCQSNKFIDNSTNNLTLTVNGTPKVQTQNPFQVNTGQSYYFDGTGDYLALKEDTGLWNFGTGDFSIEAWVNPAARVTNSAYIIGRSQYGVGSDWAFWINNSGNLVFYMLAGGSNIVTSTGTVPLNAWTHVAVVRSGTTVRLYINGTNDGTLTGFSSALTVSYGPTVVGNSSNNTGSTYFNGYIADLRVTRGYARTISVPTIPLLLR